MPLFEKTASWFNQPFLANPLWLWIVAVLGGTGVFLVLRFALRVAISRLEPLSARTENVLDGLLGGLLHRTHVVFLLALAVLVGSLSLSLGEKGAILQRVIILVALLQGGVWAAALFAGLLARWRQKGSEGGAPATAMVVFDLLGKSVIWSVVVLLALDNLGVKVTTLLAGLGIGGIAVALAVQNILGDLFASASIVLDKPFEIGDFICVGDFLGNVEHVGIKTTRLRSLSGEQLVLSNSDLLSSRIRNFKRMLERRVPFTIGVTYETAHEKLVAIPAMLRGIVELQESARFDRAHFARFGDFALVFEVVYYVKSPNYNLYMDIQQAINLEISRRFKEEGITFAYPTQTLYLHGLPEGAGKTGGSSSPALPLP